MTAALAAVVFVSAIGLFDVTGLRDLTRMSWREGLLFPRRSGVSEIERRYGAPGPKSEVEERIEAGPSAA